MLKNEWMQFGKNKILLISSIVILFIPILYGGFFLKSIWDPYGETGNLPVAVVNHDEKTEYGGKTLDVGNELVDNLKKNNDLGWHFVSQKSAEQGIKDGKYFMVVTIPKNFSKNASTLLDKNPQKMNLSYKINPSQNYVGEVVTEQAANQLKSQVATKITKEYAKSVFAQIKEVGKGMTTAANGAKKLDDGSTKLAAGNKTLTKGLDTLANSTLTFKDGTSQIQVAVSEATAGTQKLADGAKSLSAGENEFSTKLGEYTNGTQKLANGSAELYPGSNKVTGGLADLKNQVPALSSGATQLNGGVDQLNKGIAELKKKVDAGLKESNTPAQKAKLQQLKSGANNLESAVAELNKNLNTSSDTSKNKLTTGLNQVQAGISKLQASNTSYDAAIDAGIDNEMKQAGIDLSSAEAQKIVATAKAGAKGGAKKVTDGQAKAFAEINAGIDQLKVSSNQIADAIYKLNAQVPTLANGTNELVGKTESTIDEFSQISAALGALSNGGSKLASGTNQLTSSIPTLSNGVNALYSGSKQVTDGIGSLNGGLQTLTDNNAALNAGSTTLAKGANELTGGLNQMNSQLPLLNNGIGQLGNGASELNNGAIKLTAGSTNLGNGIKQVGDGSRELSGKLKDGAEQVNDTKATNKTFNMFATPAKLTEHKMSEVPNYGHGLAPYVLSLGLYVGALVFNFIFPIRRPAIDPTSGLSWWLSKASIGASAAVLQALILDSIMMMLGLHVDHIGAFILTSVLTSLAFMFFVMFLAITLGNPGRFFAMVLLVLQLGGAGGTFPLPLTNGFFNAIHPFLPMSYSVYSFRDAISSGLGTSLYVHSSLVLLSIFVVTNLLLMWVLTLRHNKRFKLENQTLIPGGD
ncbi:YhgE/Pip family protein [Listeria aquatica]|uniref:YhgE/Pip family protein n=1 Tax=Listeria aquatica TaxID=1494960 RepID=UPI003F729D67